MDEIFDPLGIKGERFGEYVCEFVYVFFSLVGAGSLSVRACFPAHHGDFSELCIIDGRSVTNAVFGQRNVETVANSSAICADEESALFWFFRLFKFFFSLDHFEMPNPKSDHKKSQKKD